VPKRPLADVIASLSARWKTATKTETMHAQRVRPAALAAGSRWRDLHILSKLGEGESGAVYHARYALDRDVALKSSTAMTPSAKARRWRSSIIEYRAVYSCDLGADGASLSMELIQGQNLEKFAIERRSIGRRVRRPDLSAPVPRPRAGAQQGVVHRDIRASNVMRQEDGRIVLVDFGLGRRPDPQDDSGEVTGTLPYLAPEILRGLPASPRSDPWDSVVSPSALGSRAGCRQKLLRQAELRALLAVVL
jgi:eukaryotic-like serine/threonine-protein kinase